MFRNEGFWITVNIAAMKRFEFGGFVYFFGHTEYTIQRSDSKKKKYIYLNEEIYSA